MLPGSKSRSYYMKHVRMKWNRIITSLCVLCFSYFLPLELPSDQYCVQFAYYMPDDNERLGIRVASGDLHAFEWADPFYLFSLELGPQGNWWHQHQETVNLREGQHVRIIHKSCWIVFCMCVFYVCLCLCLLMCLLMFKYFPLTDRDCRDVQRWLFGCGWH